MNLSFVLSVISIISLIIAFVLLVVVFMISSFRRNYDYAIILGKIVTCLAVFATVTMLIVVCIK